MFSCKDFKHVKIQKARPIVEANYALWDIGDNFQNFYLFIFTDNLIGPMWQSDCIPSFPKFCKSDLYLTIQDFNRCFCSKRRDLQSSLQWF